MNDAINTFPEPASTSASEVEYLSYALLSLTAIFTLGIACAVLFFITRYWHTRDVNRKSSDSLLVHWIVESIWSIGPLIILLSVFFWGAVVFVRAHQPPDEAIDIYVVGKQWMWKIGHAGGRREINNLHVPIGTPVRLTMISEDVIHCFYVPAFRIKQDVLPGRYSTLWFEPTRPGTYHLFCSEYCGTDHSQMGGTVVVQTPDEYAKWLADEDVISIAQRGRRVIDAVGCLKCHAQFDGAQTGPLLTGLYGREVALEGGKSVFADDAYIRRALLDPKAEQRAGYQGIMPSYRGQLSPEQILDITAYLRSIADATGPIAGPGNEVQSPVDVDNKIKDERELVHPGDKS